jgi:cytoskeletal protein CcmA (bactofilin family)
VCVGELEIIEMWKRNEDISLTQGDAPRDERLSDGDGPPLIRRQTSEMERPAERDLVNIGKSVVVKGELSGSEDLTIEGKVEGKIELSQHVLTIGPNGKIKAQIHAKSVIVLGKVNGNVVATERVSIREKGAVDGDITAPKVAIAEGAHFRGSVDMQGAVGVASRKASVPGKVVATEKSSSKGLSDTTAAGSKR